MRCHNQRLSQRTSAGRSIISGEKCVNFFCHGGSEYHDEIMSFLLQFVLIDCMQNFRDTVKFLYKGIRLQDRMPEIMNYMFENYQNTLRY